MPQTISDKLFTQFDLSCLYQSVSKEKAVVLHIFNVSDYAIYLFDRYVDFSLQLSAFSNHWRFNNITHNMMSSYADGSNRSRKKRHS
jgi:hypothetical protein